MAKHQADIPWGTNMHTGRVDQILVSPEDENDHEFKMKIMAAARPLNAHDRSTYRQIQSYNQDDDSMLSYGFDMSLYSLKYAGCSAISSFSDSLAQDASATTVFKTIENVVFRLCPKNTCYDWTVYGCLFDYGEYIIRLDTWMQLISTYREEKLYKYCQACKQCVGNGRDRGLHQTSVVSHFTHSSRNVAGENENNYEMDDGSIDCETYASTCSDYVDMCEFVVHDPNEYSNYLGCTAVSADNGSTTVYLGPHCSSDKATIVIGVFSDSQCSEYIGNSYDVYSLTGINFDLSSFYKTNCYSCEQKVGTMW